VSVTLAARLTWKDHRGATRFASVTTRNISEHGVYVECLSPLPLSMYRLVHVQLERDERAMAKVPQALRDGRILSAVYRINPATPGRPQGLALRLMVDPKRALADAADRHRATA
jgi:hypothetical protein